MQGEFGEFLVSGLPMLALLPIPVLTVVSAVALGIGLARRRLVVVASALALAGAVAVGAEALRSLAADPRMVDTLVMQLPLALALSALTAIVRLAPAGFRVVRRRVRTLDTDAVLSPAQPVAAPAAAE